ncbi:tRNA pseudouridine(55) synthase TruB [Alienimonas chondri]|uniref:tRNA pseudouridine synthase B n=1 Tax=Alienimonas chondri TaxID=2681879 RepID=A0ABX1VBF5_9PLAN|nr:tRNA pseudouridine(55) synthase TruB [Alienimonas chondri]NNJ24756.1 tRNA pseudouridine synthase B [Alienimonas chondri]
MGKPPPPIPPAGLLVLNKPAGVTSRAAVNIVQGAARDAGWGRRVKVGHAGTLDPIATGVLVVCVGKATRLIDRVQAQPKTYEAGFLLHTSSPSLDVEHEPVPVPNPPSLSRDQIDAALPAFLGEIDQTPPAFSAVKVGGRRAYKLAREGEEVTIESKRVRVDRLEVTGYDGERLGLRIECGSGFYVRSLGRDLAKALGTEAVMESLLRSRIGGFDLDGAVTPDDVTAESLPGLLSLSFERFGLTTLTCDDAQAGDLRGGRYAQIPFQDAPGEPGECGVRDKVGRPVCLAERDRDGTLRPKVTFPLPTVE